jgi:hypothetical protein
MRVSLKKGGRFRRNLKNFSPSVCNYISSGAANTHLIKQQAFQTTCRRLNEIERGDMMSFISRQGPDLGDLPSPSVLASFCIPTAVNWSDEAKLDILNGNLAARAGYQLLCTRPAPARTPPIKSSGRYMYRPELLHFCFMLDISSRSDRPN